MSTVYTSMGLAQDEIRVLLLHSRTSSNVGSKPKSAETSNKEAGVPHIGAPIRCKLYRVLQSDNPSYQALSYTWGDAISPTPIMVNGVEVLVTENLLEALTHIRDEQLDIPLWVDALCINQLDIVEKAEQVKQMGQIYRNAARTIIWLGPEHDQSQETMSELSQIGHILLDGQMFDPMLKKSQWSGDYEPLATAMRVTLAEKFSQYLQNLPVALEFLTGCSMMLSRRYWSRVWIIQEFVVSSSISLLCGRAKISFYTFRAACMALPLLFNFLGRSLMSPEGDVEIHDEALFTELLKIDTNSTSTYELIGMRGYYHMELGQPVSLFYAMYHVHSQRRFKARDDKDLVYGLLGMVSDLAATGVEPDYDISQSCSEIYTSAARAAIHIGGVDMLSLVQHRLGEPPRDVPSWVPDWRREIYPPLGQDPLLSSFQVSGSAPFVLAPGSESLPKDQIKLPGYLFNTVEIVGTKAWRPPYPSQESLSISQEQYLNSIAALCQKSDEKLDHPYRLPDPYLRPDDRASAAPRTPVADMERHGGNGFLRHGNKPSGDEVAYEKLENGYYGATEAFRLGNKVIYRPETTEYFSTMSSQKFRRGVLLENGLVGTAPEIVEVGDAIVIFQGAKLPYVLRKAEDRGTRRWTLVGEAYIHGIMYGELFLNRTSPRGLHLEEFVLK